MKLNKSTFALLQTKEFKEYIANHYSVSIAEVGKWVRWEQKGKPSNLTSEFGLNILLKYRNQELKEFHISNISDLIEQRIRQKEIKPITSKKKYRFDMTGRKHFKRGENF